MTFVSILGIAVAANADVLLNTFGTVTSPGFDVNGSYAVYYAQSVARPFVTSFGSYNLTEIDIALAFFTTDSVLNVNLCADNAGVPGSILETFGVINVGGDLSSGSEYVLNSVTHPLLTMGGTYYVTITPGTPGSSGGWNFTNDGHTGPNQWSSNGGITWNSVTELDGAVTVQGALTSVPEPTSLAVLGLGAVALIRRRRITK